MSSDKSTVVVVNNNSNGLGTAGFVISLIGFLTCGFISPLGLLLSMIGLLFQPRGLAIAGTLLGTLGSAWLFLGGLAIIAGVFGIGAAARESANEMARQAQVATSVDQSDQSIDPIDEPIDLIESTATMIDLEPVESHSIEESPVAVPDVPPADPVEPLPPADPAEPLPPADPSPSLRTWSDSTGSFKIEATFKGLISGRVVLEKRDGTEIKVPIDRLSDADKEYIEQIKKDRL